MRALMTGVILVLITAVSGCDGARTGAPTMLRVTAGESLSSDQKEKIIAALKVLFEDPATGNVPTTVYKNYLALRQERFPLEMQMASSEDPIKRRIQLTKLQALDDKFGLINSELKPAHEKALDDLYRLNQQLWGDSSSMELIRQKDAVSVEEWEKARSEILELINAETNHAKRAVLNRQLELLNSTFRYKHTGFLSNLNAG